MPQSLSKILIHTIFSTKNREPFFADKIIRQEMHAYLGGTSKKLNALPIVVGGVSDHVHLLTTFPRTETVANFVKEIKRVSTNWIHEKGNNYQNFHWQGGYGVFSVSETQADKVIEYIQHQEKHHKTRSFQEEYRELLDRHGITFDEQYVWD